MLLFAFHIIAMHGESHTEVSLTEVGVMQNMVIHVHLSSVEHMYFAFELGALQSFQGTALKLWNVINF